MLRWQKRGCQKLCQRKKNPHQSFNLNSQPLPDPSSNPILMPAPLFLTVVGGGNSTPIFAALAKQAGFSVAILTRRPSDWSVDVGFVNEGLFCFVCLGPSLDRRQLVCESVDGKCVDGENNKAALLLWWRFSCFKIHQLGETKLTCRASNQVRESNSTTLTLPDRFLKQSLIQLPS